MGKRSRPEMDDIAVEQNRGVDDAVGGDEAFEDGRVIPEHQQLASRMSTLSCSDREQTRAFVARHGGLPPRADLARYTSYMSRLPATARFSESAEPTMGMRTKSVQRSRWAGDSP